LWKLPQFPQQAEAIERVRPFRFAVSAWVFEQSRSANFPTAEVISQEEGCVESCEKLGNSLDHPVYIASALHVHPIGTEHIGNYKSEDISVELKKVTSVYTYRGLISSARAVISSSFTQCSTGHKSIIYRYQLG
jgi:hypothetical protein